MARDLVTDVALFPFRYTYNRIMSPSLEVHEAFSDTHKKKPVLNLLSAET
jgi:hypothetical protein